MTTGGVSRHDIETGHELREKERGVRKEKGKKSFIRSKGASVGWEGIRISTKKISN
jgi:hypothetical protein